MVYVPLQTQSFDPKVVAIDYDNTISLNESGFINVFNAFRHMGFKIICVTYRYPNQDPWELAWLEKGGIQVYYTSRKAKRRFLFDLGIKVDIWIDDMPETICLDEAKMAQFPYP